MGDSARLPVGESANYFDDLSVAHLEQKPMPKEHAILKDAMAGGSVGSKVLTASSYLRLLWIGWRRYLLPGAFLSLLLLSFLIFLNYLGVLQIFPAFSGVLGGLWVAGTYLDQQTKARAERGDQLNQENIARKFEAQKPFSEIQLATFIEAGKVVGYLAAFDKGEVKWSERREWRDKTTRFYELFWTELSLVEDDLTKKAMEKFSHQLLSVIGHPDDVGKQHELNQRAYRLARQLRASIEKTWQIDLGPVDDIKHPKGNDGSRP